MPVKIRLARRGRKKRAMYDVVVADSRAPRDGRFIEKIGIYNPTTDPAFIDIDADKAFQWVMDGAQPTDTVRAMLSYKGVMFRKHLQLGVIKGALTQEEADKKLDEWVEAKETKIQGKVDKITKAKADVAKAKLAAEAKVNQARIDAQLAKRKAAEAELAAVVAEANADEAEKALEAEGAEAVAEATTTEEAKAEEAPVEEVKTEETPVEEAKTEEAPKEATPVEEAKAEETPAEEAPVAEAKAEEEAPAAEGEEKSK